jgi:hypothetical protein
MSLALFVTSDRANERGRICCTLPSRLVTHVSTQVALQRCPIICISSWIISLFQVGAFSKLKWHIFIQYYFSVILGSSGYIFKVKVGSFSILKNRRLRCLTKSWRPGAIDHWERPLTCFWMHDMRRFDKAVAHEIQPF